MTMSSNKMSSLAPCIGDQPQPIIPLRTSSVSRARISVQRGRPIPAIRTSLVLDDGREIDFLDGHHDSDIIDTSRSRSLQRASSPSPKMNRKSVSCAPTTRDPIRPAKAQRWAGLTRSVSNWDGLRKDPELWSQDGDCHVHLYARGASRRGPSFCVPLQILRQKNCGAMLNVCYAQEVLGALPNMQEPRRLHSFNHLNRGSRLVELYIPAPENASREESFNWHITTRNFFAYVLGKPLVGHHMGEAFVSLQERMQLFRTQHANNHQDLLHYLEEQGYRDLVECTDYALASLYYAERFKLRDVWIDAFAHCVGMNDSLALSPEYPFLSRLTKALITRAYLDVDIRLDDVAKALRNFLQDDFSPAFLGLTDGARSHMNRFRRFLHSYYVDKYGYWPPPKNVTSFPKALYKSMFYDFNNLYKYLVDTSSTTSLSSQKPASGGICVLQNLDNFDKRHKFIPQPHPLPLLPEDASFQIKLDSQIRRSLSSASQSKRSKDVSSKTAALATAANTIDPKVVNSDVVQAYMRFEREYSAIYSQREEKLTAADARKVRWLLIYGTLQYLASALRAPPQVRDTQTADYPLCCLITSQSAWKAGTSVSTPPVRDSAIGGCFDKTPGSPPLEIQPDCQREDYFNCQPASRQGGVELSTPLKTVMSSCHNSSSPFSPLSSLPGRSSKRDSVQIRPTPTMPNGGDVISELKSQAEAEVPWLKPRPVQDEIPPIPGVRCHKRTRTPLLHSSQIDGTTRHTTVTQSCDLMSRSDSTSSSASSVWTDGGSIASSKSSADIESRRSSKPIAAEHNDLLNGLVSVNGSRVRFETPVSPVTAYLSEQDIHPLLRKTPPPQDDFEFDFSNQNAETSNVESTSAKVADASTPTTASDVVPTSQNVAPLVKLLPSQNQDARADVARTNSLASTVRPATANKNFGSDSQPPIVTKTSHATKSTPLKNRMWHDDVKDMLKERRLSIFRRR